MLIVNCQLSIFNFHRGVVQSASILAWGASGRPFESGHSDNKVVRDGDFFCLLIDLGVPAAPSGFPLYLCSLNPHPLPNPVPALKSRSRTRSQIPLPSPQPAPEKLAKDAAPIPNAFLGDRKWEREQEIL